MQNFIFVLQFLVVLVFYYYRRTLIANQHILLLYIAIFTFIEDFGGHLLTIYQLINNMAYYSILSTIILLLYFYFYYQQIKNAAYKRIILYAAIFLGIFSVLNIIFIQKLFEKFTSYNFCIGSVIMCVIICMYVVETMKSDLIIDLKKNLLFWVSIGLFFYYLMNIPVMAGYNYLLESDSFTLRMIYRYITNVVLYIQYTLFIIGAICMKRT
ncbi:MAG: hypothetical protein IPO85_07815 [Saprospiraceae bacterium]|uniref:Uncharacterized protein n=1 Tax=Candidatus Defluviibacterium haderslevense TaxID=2981993 RepID=A0A9D7S7L1_9BACT|nr:hypothetical protein [Candidatus Defluviibacterium haderslevense]